MSTVKTKKVQLGTDATASNNFTLYQPATPDGTLRIGVGNADNPTEVGRFNANGYKPQQPVAFSAYLPSGYPFSPSVWTVMPLNTEEFDTNANYNTTNYRFTPTVAGYYQFNVGAGTTHGGTASIIGLGVWKNNNVGSSSIMASYVSHNSGDVKTHSCLLYMNGTTDYVDARVYNNGTSPQLTASYWETHFTGYLVAQT